MKVYKIEFKQTIPISIDKCWDFFSNPKNLKVITPSHMGFDILEEIDDKMYAGQIIQYEVKPIFGLKMHWVTEITHVDERKYFVDEQRIGPYKFWHHKHFFEETSKGVEMKDIVHYAIPYGIIGRLIHELYIRERLVHIFSYRKQIVETIFKEL